MAVTIKDVARYANVGVGTVSRVLNGGCVNDSTKDLVMKAIKELQFTPNSAAHRLRKNRTGVIAVLVPIINHPFFSEFVEVVEDEAEKFGWSVLIVSSQQKINKEKSIIEKIHRKEIDGAIFVTHYKHDKADLVGCPFVSIDRPLSESIPYVTSDNYQSTANALEYLISKGCKKIGYVGSKPIVDSEVMHREKAYLDTMAKYGLPPRIVNDVIIHGDERKVVDTFFSDYPDVDGIFAAGFTMAQMTYNVAKEKGYSVPNGLQIVAYDGSFQKWGSSYSLTAVEQPIAEMARTIVKLLADVIDGKDVPVRTVLEAKFVKGNTTK
ncbi:MAG: LacI family transcriptional regulator [Clostridia bacterium]|nr:LacI family transcriptional regulator [Clostridia bacterium]